MNEELVLSFIHQYYLKNGVPPSVREIQEACKFKSPRSVSLCLAWLTERRFLVRTKGWARGYIPVGFKVVREDAAYSA